MIAYKPYHINTKLGLGAAQCPIPLPQSYRPSSFPHRYTTTAAASTPPNSNPSKQDLPTTNFNPSSPPSPRGDHIIADTSDEEKYLPDDPGGLDEELILDPKVTIHDVYKDTKMKKKKEKGSEDVPTTSTK